MGLFIGIEAGESRHGCTGATRRTVRLAIDEAGQVATIDDRRIAVGPDTLVLWHESDAGTFTTTSAGPHLTRSSRGWWPKEFRSASRLRPR